MNADSEPVQDGGEPKARIFISYSRKDLAFTDHLEAALRARGFEPLIDRSEIYFFEDWWKRIEEIRLFSGQTTSKRFATFKSRRARSRRCYRIQRRRLRFVQLVMFRDWSLPEKRPAPT
jgi:hypothetical protein